ncbi:MAG: ACT domain-containing protein [Chloroflexi bacterium]|nr:ACT domain-containing protein [Chloroflexota bacterium]
MSQVNHVSRIIVMARDEVGVIADISQALADEGINMESINAQVVGEEVTIVLTADRTDRALYILNQAGFKAVSDDALVLRLPDEPGALAGVAGSLKEAGVNIESMHILSRQAGYAMIALKTDNRAEAMAAIGNEVIV